MEKQLGLLDFMNVGDTEGWNLTINIRQPIFVEKEKVYVSGIGCKLELKSSVGEETPPLARLNASISGKFSTEGGFSVEQEESLVRTQMPAILFPYLRGAVTSFLANAGFGPFIFPLINMQEVAKQSLKDVKPKIIADQ